MNTSPAAANAGRETLWQPAADAAGEHAFDPASFDAVQGAIDTLAPRVRSALPR